MGSVGQPGSEGLRRWAGSTGEWREPRALRGEDNRTTLVAEPQGLVQLEMSRR